MSVTPQGDLFPPDDRRGKARSPKAIDRDIVKKHILSIPGGISHYRRAHAPRVRYVAPELTLKYMYRLYKDSDFFKEPNAACHYEVYRQV